MTAGTGLKRTEHNGPKRGKGPDKKADVKSVSKRLRRVNDRLTIREIAQEQMARYPNVTAYLERSEREDRERGAT